MGLGISRFFGGGGVRRGFFTVGIFRIFNRLIGIIDIQKKEQCIQYSQHLFEHDFYFLWKGEFLWWTILLERE